MADELDSGQVKLRIIGMPAFNDRVLADVFARKLGSLIKAMAAADYSVNGGKRFDFVIVKLDANSPATATVAEQRSSKVTPLGSGVEVFGQCVRSINSGNFIFARSHLECAKHVKKLANEVGTRFEHAELTVNGFAPFIVDQFFLKQAAEAITIKDAEIDQPKWFRGSAIGTFDGTILETDLRGEIPRVILRLTAGGKDINCVCPGLTVEDIKPVLKKRVRLTGSAFYDGKSGMPVRIEVSRTPELVRMNADFSRWRGAFSPFSRDEWGDES